MDILKNVNLNLLKSFWAVYKTGGINKAANLLEITPPTLSHNIKQLERQIGKKLFITHKKGATPTDDATALFPLIESAFDNLLKCNEQLNAQQSGKIVIGTSTIQASFFLAKFLSNFQSKYPHIKLEIVHHPKHDYLGELDNNRIDVAIMTFPERADEQHAIFELRKLDMTFFATAQFAGAHNLQSELTFAQFVSLPFIMIADPKHYQAELENLFGQKLKTIEAAGAHQAYYRAMDSQGVSLMFEEFLDAQKSERIVKLKIKDMPPPPPVIIKCAHHKKPSALVALFVKELKAWYHLL